ncbi:tRNA pseudouridine(38-40) synthase TruA [Planctomicrobium sp. SH664]|uniref:tRNA pseudouridine(38-40) synthase TruA n=1 Tax=Planctomicrobium sp. SH664 TaxID=3448125 RepID=UPI003F5C7F62
MPNIRLRLTYDGTNYSGWQIQPNRPTIQGLIEEALLKVTGEKVNVYSTGRTDAGVHALGQVANFHTPFPIPPHKWRPALQALLPEDIVILESDLVPDEFHATFSAVSKRYRYVIYNRLVADPFARRYSWRIGQPLNLEAMQAASRCLLGTHDFRSFESHWPNKASSVRTVLDLTFQSCAPWQLFTGQPLSKQAHSTAEQPFLCLEIEADGFLYNMVRTITGTLVNVGRGTWTAADIERVLQAQDRSIAGGTAPAHGLFLVCANYGHFDQPAATNGPAPPQAQGEKPHRSHTPASSDMIPARARTIDLRP